MTTHIPATLFDPTPTVCRRGAFALSATGEWFYTANPHRLRRDYPGVSGAMFTLPAYMWGLTDHTGPLPRSGEPPAAGPSRAALAVILDDSIPF